MAKKLIIYIFTILSIFSTFSQKPVYAYSFDPATIDDMQLSVEAQGAVLIELSTGKVLFQKNKDQRLFPASTTKILTALIAIENGDLAEIVTVGNEANLAALDGSKAGLDIGEEISLSNLLIALMYPSGNDAGYTIAVHIGRKLSGDPDKETNEAIAVFTDLMNQRSQEIGATNSNFTNPHGYHHADHYTTAHDLALITRTAMQNDFFKNLVAERFVQYPDWSSAQETPPVEEMRNWASRNRLLNSNSEFFYPYATGVKTGWTTPAGPCLVSSANKNGMELISVVLNSSRTGQWTDSINMFEFGFNSFDFHRLIDRNQSMGALEVYNYSLEGDSIVNVVTQEGFEDLFLKADVANVVQNITWNYNCPEGNSRIVAPVKLGDILGVATFTLDNEIIFKTNLLATTNIEKRTLISTIVYRVQRQPLFSSFLYIPLALLFLFFVIRFILKIKKKYRFKKRLTYRSYS